MSIPDPVIVAKHLIRLAGGHKAAFERFDAGYIQFLALWNQDADRIGRILRAHLFVEHFLTELLYAKCPQLGPLEDARLSFAQKVAMLATTAAEIQDLLPGIRRLNKVRNRIAHSLHSDLTNEDAEVLLGCVLFSTMRVALAERNVQKPSAEPLVVTEDFALHVGTRIQAIVSGNGALWGQAIQSSLDEASDPKSK